MIDMFDNRININVDKHAFEDICISALRYALYRHTYVLDATIDFIMTYHDAIINERVYGVMLRDIKERLDGWARDEHFLLTHMMDYECIEAFRDWMVNYGKEKGYSNVEYWWGPNSV